MTHFMSTQRIKNRLTTFLPLATVVTTIVIGFGMTQAHAVDIRQAQIEGCTNELVAYQITDAASANQLCTCDIDIQARMTIGQVWEIQSYIASDRDPSTLPHFAQMQRDSSQCREGLALNPPQPPQQPAVQ